MKFSGNIQTKFSSVKKTEPAQFHKFIKYLGEGGNSSHAK